MLNTLNGTIAATERVKSRELLKASDNDAFQFLAREMLLLAGRLNAAMGRKDSPDATAFLASVCCVLNASADAVRDLSSEAILNALDTISKRLTKPTEPPKESE